MLRSFIVIDVPNYMLLEFAFAILFLKLQHLGADFICLRTLSASRYCSLVRSELHYM
jgi:hypothetical protein